MNNENRIPADQLDGVDRIIFSKLIVGGPDLSKRLNIGVNTLWTWFNRIGVPVSVAYRTSDIMVEWAIELLQRAASLRAVAEKYALEPKQPRYRVPRTWNARHPRASESTPAAVPLTPPAESPHQAVG